MSEISLEPILSSLISPSNSLASRFRALFTLKGIAISPQTSDSKLTQIISSIGQTFSDDSALLKHESAYVLGQIKSKKSENILIEILKDLKQDEMVRHEAAEALGAIGLQSSIPTLEQYLNDESVSVKETCTLAIEKIKHDNHHDNQGKSINNSNPNKPIDPAPSLKPLDSLPTSEEIQLLKEKLLDDQSQLFLRYRAMFSLRDVVLKAKEEENGEGKSEGMRENCRSLAREATLALASGLDSDVNGGALFRHEICFVFGEISHKSSIPSLLRSLKDSEEHEMVRHEAAEALGGIIEEELDEGNLDFQELKSGQFNADEQRPDPELKDGERALRKKENQERKLVKEAIETLKNFSKDDQLPRVVRESCIVALDEMAYNNDPSQFQRLENTHDNGGDQESEIQASALPQTKDQVGGGSSSTKKEDFQLEGLQHLAGAHNE